MNLLFDYSNPAYIVTRVRSGRGMLGVIIQEEGIFHWAMVHEINHTAKWKRAETRIDAEKAVVFAMGIDDYKLEEARAAQEDAVLDTFGKMLGVLIPGPLEPEDDPWDGDILPRE